MMKITSCRNWKKRKRFYLATHMLLKKGCSRHFENLYLNYFNFFWPVGKKFRFKFKLPLKVTSINYQIWKTEVTHQQLQKAVGAMSFLEAKEQLQLRPKGGNASKRLSHLDSTHWSLTHTALSVSTQRHGSWAIWKTNCWPTCDYNNLRMVVEKLWKNLSTA